MIWVMLKIIIKYFWWEDAYPTINLLLKFSTYVEAWSEICVTLAFYKCIECYGVEYYSIQ